MKKKSTKKYRTKLELLLWYNVCVCVYFKWGKCETCNFYEVVKCIEKLAMEIDLTCFLKLKFNKNCSMWWSALGTLSKYRHHEWIFQIVISWLCTYHNILHNFHNYKSIIFNEYILYLWNLIPLIDIGWILNRLNILSYTLFFQPEACEMWTKKHSDHLEWNKCKNISKLRFLDYIPIKT